MYSGPLVPQPASARQVINSNISFLVTGFIINMGRSRLRLTQIIWYLKIDCILSFFKCINDKLMKWNKISDRLCVRNYRLSAGNRQHLQAVA